MKNGLEKAVFGGGCFWCTEAIFQQLKGVHKVTPGYAGGTLENPSYEDLHNDDTGHAEVIEIEFDPKTIPFRDLLDVFWHTHDPTSVDRQGADRGPQYRSIILYTSENQLKIAQEQLQKLDKSGEFPLPIVTQIKPLVKFYEAESHHQNFYEKNSYSPYCQVVISPKLKHLREKYSTKLKSNEE